MIAQKGLCKLNKKRLKMHCKFVLCLKMNKQKLEKREGLLNNTFHQEICVIVVLTSNWDTLVLNIPVIMPESVNSSVIQHVISLAQKS